ncbi:MAG: hypothetical protein KH123_08500, partial [Azospirillum sp.]|nr:hypothetical protein [Azospirillum sp.]
LEPKPERGARGNGGNVGYADKRGCGIKAPRHQTIHTYRISGYADLGKESTINETTNFSVYQ